MRQVASPSRGPSSLQLQLGLTDHSTNVGGPHASPPPAIQAPACQAGSATAPPGCSGPRSPPQQKSGCTMRPWPHSKCGPGAAQASPAAAEDRPCTPVRRASPTPQLTGGRAPPGVFAAISPQESGSTSLPERGHRHSAQLWEAACVTTNSLPRPMGLRGRPLAPALRDRAPPLGSIAYMQKARAPTSPQVTPKQAGAEQGQIGPRAGRA
ncbi:hypothetical protein NDU88_008332 [Pleurodeles waltl]|uniref:Uncharacterized protein n=1 Tax=Pleurodeles waltl TaxID=8319 RepID=A0AAV7NYP1_PLEWA|nr:hypothetical protein NDU88_008332 [Pleurodeles waltl]